MRETGIMIAVPELWGHVFVGRTKEGFSLNKVMIGYAGWTMERSTISDATIPILADGIKWLGYLPEHRILWNLGVYGDWLSEGQSLLDLRQAGRRPPGLAARRLRGTAHGPPPGYEPALRQAEGRRAEAALAAGGLPGALLRRHRQVRRPTDEDGGLEGYYRPGPLLVGTEYFFQ